MREFVQDAVACNKLTLDSLFLCCCSVKRKLTCSGEEIGLFAAIAPAGFAAVPERYSWILAFGFVKEKELCLGGGKEKAAETDDLVITGGTVRDGNTRN